MKTTVKQIWYDSFAYDYEDFCESYSQAELTKDEADYAYADEIEFYQAETVSNLSEFIARYEKRYRTHVTALLLIAVRHQPVYGNWNGLEGRIGYRLIVKPDELFRTSSDDIRIYVGDDNFIHADYYDHDGSDNSTIKLITQAALKEDEAQDCKGNDYSLQAFADKLDKNDKLTPTKFWPGE